MKEHKDMLYKRSYFFQHGKKRREIKENSKLKQDPQIVKKRNMVM